MKKKQSKESKDLELARMELSNFRRRVEMLERDIRDRDAEIKKLGGVQATNDILAGELHYFRGLVRDMCLPEIAAEQAKQTQISNGVYNPWAGR